MARIKWLCSGEQDNHYFGDSSREEQFLEAFASSKVDIDLFLNMPREGDQAPGFCFRNSDGLHSEQRFLRGLVKLSDVCFFYYNQQFVEWVMNLPQLRHDMLSLYRINPQDFAEAEESKEEGIDLEKLEKGYVKYSDYFELLKMVMNMQLNKVEKDMNFFKLINQIHLKLFVSGARFFPPID